MAGYLDTSWTDPGLVLKQGEAKGTVRAVAIGVFRGNLLAREISYVPPPEAQP